ncbi:MAG: AAA family ATPase, partial [Methanobacteriota archaeon]
MPKIVIHSEELREIYSGKHSTIYYQERSSIGKPIAIKILNDEFPSLQQIRNFYNEYDFSLEIGQHPGIRTIYEKRMHNNRHALIMEYIPGITIKERFSEERSIREFLSVAIAISHVLETIHTHHIIHKDINSNNILVCPPDNTVHIIDLGIASKLDARVQNLGNPKYLKGTLLYLSPEQTGRMNRVVDYRTDLYSLGVTFYEMVTGRLTFVSDDPMEIVHAHIAHHPTPPHEVNKNIPDIISKIILKLLEKNAEDRYQSVMGLHLDLSQCLAIGDDTDTIPSFVLGCNDFSERLLIPQTLYGVATERKILLDMYDQLAEGGVGCMMVTGHSGVGKTSLVFEVHKPVTEHRGYFISGKYDQYEQTLPYSAIIQALSNLINLILTEDGEKIRDIRNAIEERVGSNGKVLVDLIPNLELILGQQSTIPVLDPIESINRFNLVCRNFFRAVSTPDHPLTLFLDDLQWADHASLSLIQILMNDEEIRSFLFIGAYRDNEVDISHPLIQTLEEIKKTPASVQEIMLSDLSQRSITSLLVDTLHIKEGDLSDLSRIISEKTKGNAFFVHQFLRSLNADGLLIFDTDNQRWRYDIQKIEKRAYTENVVDLVVRKLENLPLEEQQILRIASCIGNVFSLQTIAEVTNRTPAQIIAHLNMSLHEGLIIPQDDNLPLIIHSKEPDTIRCDLAFLHDRIQQAAYTLIPEEEKASLHLKIARTLLNSYDEQDDSSAFQITGHYNLSLHLITDESERVRVAELNLKSGSKAKNATAFVSARDFLETGMHLLPSHSWERMHELTFNLFLNRAECEYTLRQFEISKNLLEEAFQHAISIEERLLIAIQRINQASWEVRFLDSIHIGIQALKEYDIVLPPLEDNAAIEDYIKTQVQQFSDNWDDKPVSDLTYLSENCEATYHLLTHILGNLIDAAVIEYPFYLPVLTYTSVNLSIQHGITLDSSYGCICHALILSSSTRDFDVVHEFTQVGLALSERIPDKKVRCKVLNLFTFVGYVRAHLAEIPAYGEQAYHLGVESGDYIYAGYSLANGHRTLISAGVPLPECYQKGEAYLSFIKKLNQKFTYESMLVNVAPFIRELTGLTLQPEAYNPDIIAELLKTPHINFITAITRFYMSMAMYILERYDEARLLITADILPYLEILSIRVEFRLIASLLYLQNSSRYTPAEKEQNLKIVSDYLAFLNHIASSAPYNFLSHVRLIEAELARVDERPLDAMNMYDEAIKLAHENNLIQYEAIASECAGKFWVGMKKPDIASVYLRKAAYCYELWGASVKVEAMKRKYPDILSHKSKTLSSTTYDSLIYTSSNSLTTQIEELDLITIIKASQTISEEIRLDMILEKMMHFMIENAGATKGVLLTMEGGAMIVQAARVVQNDSVETMIGIPMREYSEIPHSIINFTEKTRKPLILDNASDDPVYDRDPYIRRTVPQSVLCMPIENKSQLIGILYLENNLSSGAFTRERFDLLKILGTQVAISIENARLYQYLETEVAQRTSDLKKALQDLEEKHDNLLRTQNQLLESEKMASLGTLIAGVAHEINNPANYLYISSKTLETEISNFQKEMLEVVDDSDAEANEYLHTRFDTFHRSLQHILDGSSRINTIIQDLRSVSRFQDTYMEMIRVVESLDSSIRIVKAK